MQQLKLAGHTLRIPVLGILSAMGIFRQLHGLLVSGGKSGLTFARGNSGLSRRISDQTDEELLRLALDAVDLTPEPNLVLSSELSRRGINTARPVNCS